MDKESFEKKILETIHDKDYESLVNAMDRLLAMPYSYTIKDFIFQYAKPLMSSTKTYEAPKTQVDSDGRQWITVYGKELDFLFEFFLMDFVILECLRKRARGDVTIRMPGSGKISINGQDIRYFESDQNREQVSVALLLIMNFPVLLKVFYYYYDVSYLWLIIAYVGTFSYGFHKILMYIDIYGKLCT